MEINYIGEHILAGTTGRIAITLSFLAALFSTVMYFTHAFLHRKGKEEPGPPAKRSAAFPVGWPGSLLIARGAFYLHLVFMVVASVALYTLIFAHAFEYRYVWQYTSVDLPLPYLVSSFWAGQEGSYLIWAIFQGLLGWVLLRRVREWESPVMGVIALSQVFLMLMLLGWNIGGLHLGSDPFQLLRNAAENASSPFFLQPAYASMIADGQGLNPLLENIWMAIHPPLLFLGYASVLIPFALATGGLWRGDHQGWRSLALPWINFAALCLGVGIILGGAWAYVSLTFGGFWAWDPVENASLVPWLFVVATLHVTLIARKKPHYLVWSYLFAFLSYFFVLYASYLTRSGVLKDASAHAFGDAESAIFLVIYNLVFLVFPILLLILRRPSSPEKTKDNLSSREFWMFIGTLVMTLSAFQIILTTSIPVINKIFGSSLAPPTDAVSFYNAWQLPYAILIALLVGLTFYMKYGESPFPAFLKKTLPALIVSLVVIILFGFFFPFDNPLHYLFLFFTIFMMYTTVEGMLAWKKRQKSLGSLVAHFGLSLFLFGVLVTFSHSRVISSQGSHGGMKGGEMTENQVMMKGDTVNMPPYQAVYVSRTEKGKWLHYTVDFLKTGRDGSIRKAFSLHPAINRNQTMGNVHEPATRHLLSKDVYGFITYATNMEPNAIPGYTAFHRFEIGKGDTVKYRDVVFYMDSLAADMSDPTMEHLFIRARIQAGDSSGKQALDLEYRIDNQNITYTDAILDSRNWVLRFSEVSTHGHKIVVNLYESSPDYIVMKVIIFPFILVMWTGTVILFAGFILAMVQRMSRKKKTAGSEESIATLAD
ncbi:MAG TPA: cytochrome c biogenesis protein CcsA [Bacteroidales bacterium]|nr:cytochrome c biogenesis protein CcsA [Bacteroidales bacterium]HSA44192.1 cytochrome c biogenesis protein CcsA [Bacteroidales bacterium]